MERCSPGFLPAMRKKPGDAGLFLKLPVIRLFLAKFLIIRFEMP
jgi:hypothetical protein